MTLNLNKHGAAMQAAWKAVLNPDDPTDWALFGYDGNTFDLKLVSKVRLSMSSLLQGDNSGRQKAVNLVPALLAACGQLL